MRDPGGRSTRLRFLFLLSIATSLVLAAGCGLITAVSELAGYPLVDGAVVDAAPETTPMDSGHDSGVPDAPCVPDNAADCKGACGVLKNRCGTVIACGGCPPGQACGGGGNANVCNQGRCAPSCGGKACGVSDGCDNICASGGCPTGLGCAAGNCRCGPATCSGCCGADGSCHSGAGGPGGCGTGGVACQPSSASGDCADTSCGGSAQPCCQTGPQCGAPLTCGGGGSANYCGCTPNCGPDARCGSDDGCGGICQSGQNTCPAPGQRCVNGGVCTCDPYTCGGCCSGALCVDAGCGPRCGGLGEPCCSDAGPGCVAPLECTGDGGAPTCTCATSCDGRGCGEANGCGGLCGACPEGQFCSLDAGTCACNGESCPEGCCVAGVCINGNVGNPGLCGLGTACIACSSGQCCSGGQCVDGPPDACPDI